MALLVKAEEGNEVDAEVGVKALVMETEVTASHTTDDETVDENGKRKVHPTVDNKERKKRLKTASSLSDLDKNPCMLLNEKCRDVTYDMLSQSGPVHMPIFTVQATIGDQTFIGSGPSKKRAKLAAAEIAVQSLNLYSSTVKTENPDQSTENDFKSDSEAVFQVATVSEQPGTKRDSSVLGPVESIMTKDDGISIVHGKHPVLILNELRPRAEYTAVEDERTDTGERKCTVKVDGQTFEAFGHSKKMAKAKAAEMALKKLFGLSFSYLKDGQPIYQADDLLWTKYKIKEAQPSLETFDGKNPIQMLNELFRELNYEFIDVSNDITVGTKFCVVVEIEGQTFRGEGTTKKVAKTNCAVAAVKALTESGIITNRLAEKEAKKKKVMNLYAGATDADLLDSAVIKLAVHFPELQYRLVSQNDMWNNGMMSFTVTVTVRGESFFATGPSEKAAKNLVADKVLSKLGLWSAEDMRAKNLSTKVEADSTKPSFGRGRGFRGRGFGNRGAFRGGMQGSASLGAFPDQLSSYAMPSILGNHAKRFAGGSVSWRGGSPKGGRGFQAVERGSCHGSASAGMSSYGLGEMKSNENGCGRGRGSVYGGNVFHSGRGGVGMRGVVGRSRGSANKRGQMGNSLSKAGDNFGQEAIGYSHSAGQFSRGVLDSAYQTNVVTTMSNKGSVWESSSSYGKDKDSGVFGKNSSSWHDQGNEKGHGWPTAEKNCSWKGKTMSWQSENKTCSWNDQNRKANTENLAATSWNTDMVRNHTNNIETFATEWFGEPESVACYGGAYGTSDNLLVDNYSNKLDVSSQPAEFFVKSETSEYGNRPTGEYVNTTGEATTYSMANETYSQQDIGPSYSGTAGGTYEYEGTYGAYTGMYTSEGTGNAYENYGGYSGEMDSYAMGNI